MEQEKIDTQLRKEVLRALADDENTKELDIHVGVLNGIVHMAGQVPSPEMWHRSEKIAANISGVRAVVNRLEAPGAPSPARNIQLQLAPQKRENTP